MAGIQTAVLEGCEDFASFAFCQAASPHTEINNQPVTIEALIDQLGHIGVSTFLELGASL